jgi:uncharacterized protein (DUF427 family)
VTAVSRTRSVEDSGYASRPDYRVDVLRRRNRVTARLGQEVLAETDRPLLVDEQDHGIVFYFPPGDVRLELLVATDDQTRCPFKGTASYWRHRNGEQPIAWSYLEPYPQVSQIAGYIAFYQDRVSVEVGVAEPASLGR